MTRQLDIRIDVIKSGVKIAELNAINDPTITMDAESAIKTSLVGTYQETDEIDWLKDEIRPVAIIDGTEYYLGQFIPTTIEHENKNGIKSISVEAYDRCLLVENMKTSSILHLASGTNYITAIETLLTTAGIAIVIKTPTSETLSYDREDWDIGTDYLTIVNQLLSEINYAPLWFDGNGCARLNPIQSITSSSVVRVYNEENISSLMIDESNFNLDLYETANVFLCVCSNSDMATPLTATATNDNPASPFSVQRRGKQVMEYIQVDNIASQSALNDYAQNVCTQSMFQGQILTIKTALLPECGTNDIVAIITDKANGLCVETGWEMQLATGGVMTHTLNLKNSVAV